MATDGVSTILEMIGTWVGLALPILTGLAVAVFFWGLVKFIFKADDPEAKESGKSLMIWGMVALFVMVAFWAIIGWVQTLFGVSGTVDQGTTPTADVVPVITP